jgi:hypothetical protein
LIWLAWAVILIGFQSLAMARFQPERPDRALQWLETETLADSQNNKPYLLDPFMNNQVSWDSEFYLSVATVGYDDPAVRAIPPDYNWQYQQSCVAGKDTPCYSLNYAFFPAYPYLARWVAFPLRVLRLTPIAASTLASVIVSTLGALGAMLALYDLTKDELSEAGGLRAAFYLIIFPSGFFLAQVYTEGLFVGSAFGCLALLRRKQWVGAGLLAILATWTRTLGIALVIPLAIAWLREFDWKRIDRAVMIRSLVVLAPLAAYLVWRFSAWGQAFTMVEHIYFSREPLAFRRSFEAWSEAWRMFFSDNSQAKVYYAIEFGAIILGVIACLWTLRSHPGLALFGLAVIVASLTSGAAQGMHRYVLAAPSIFLVLSRLGKSEAFDRGWTLTSTLLMGLYATLFAFDMWAG